jgi:hypothetical protein
MKSTKNLISKGVALALFVMVNVSSVSAMMDQEFVPEQGPSKLDSLKIENAERRAKEVATIRETQDRLKDESQKCHELQQDLQLQIKEVEAKIVELNKLKTALQEEVQKAHRWHANLMQRMKNTDSEIAKIEALK